MPALNLQEQFADLIAKRIKRTTIRAPRKRPIGVGDRLVLYTGQRTRRCRKLLETRCVEVSSIRITEIGIDFACPDCGWCATNRAVSLLIANADGFESVAELIDFFRRVYGLPFLGQFIVWEHQV